MLTPVGERHGLDLAAVAVIGAARVAGRAGHAALIPDLNSAYG
jgi:hypothetical protein